MRFHVSIFLMLLLSLSLQLGCGSSGDATGNEDDSFKDLVAHAHGSDELNWAKKDIAHQGFTISLGHQGNHWHGGEEIEPAVAIVKDGKDVGEATMTCQLMNGRATLDGPVAMVYEPKTDKEPAHFAGGKLKFPMEDKIYSVMFEIKFPGDEESFSDVIEVKCGH